MGSSFGVDAIKGDGVVGLNCFWNGDGSQHFFQMLFKKPIVTSNNLVNGLIQCCRIWHF
jgi:hypothetical protein